jgi:crossover junction endodeoxyribonuclease RuvC
MSRRILGIDPGLADTGFGAVEARRDNSLHCLGYGSIKTAAGESLSDRLLVISRQLEILIKQYRPELVAVEELFFCNNAKTALAVGHARGVVLLTARDAGVRLAEFTPLQVKQAVAAYGKASKLQVQRMVKLLLKLDTLPKPDDAADALAVAICASNSVN